MRLVTTGHHFNIIKSMCSLTSSSPVGNRGRHTVDGGGEALQPQILAVNYQLTRRFVPAGGRTDLLIAIHQQVEGT